MSGIRWTSSAKHSLSRSASDIPRSTITKRPRLVDTLKQSAAIMEEDEDDEDDEEDEDDSELEIESSQPLNIASRTDSQVSAKPALLQTTAKITYGQQRTYLEDTNEDIMLDMIMEDLTEPTAPTASQSQLEIDEELDDEADQGQPRSVHDLRAAGMKKRLLHEIESLVTGVEGEGPNSKASSRSALLELATKMLEPQSVSCLLDHGLDRQLLPCFARSTDTVFNFLAAICVCLIVQGADNLAVLRHLYHRSGCLPRLFELLDKDQDISKVVKERQHNMSKIAISSFVDFRTPVLESSLWSADKPKILSPRIVGLRAIELLTRKLRELKSDDTYLDEKSISHLLGIVKPQATAVVVDNLAAELTFSILESSSMGGRVPWTPKLYKTLVQILAPVLTASRDTGRVRYRALCLSVNLTNKNEVASEIFATAAFIQPLMDLMIRDFAELLLLSDEAESVFDELVLSLNALINLTELVDKARTCVLQGDNNALSKAVQIFQDSHDRTVEVCLLIESAERPC